MEESQTKAQKSQADANCGTDPWTHKNVKDS